MKTITIVSLILFFATLIFSYLVSLGGTETLVIPTVITIPFFLTGFILTRFQSFKNKIGLVILLSFISSVTVYVIIDKAYEKYNYDRGMEEYNQKFGQ